MGKIFRGEKVKTRKNSNRKKNKRKGHENANREEIIQKRE